MSRIFLSHSSGDDLAAVALRDWLASEGWDDVFLDFDPDRGIVAGQRWERRLHEAASRCEAVVFLVSANWLASGWCMKEYTTARRLNKKLFAVLIDPNKTLADLPPELTDTWQVTDLAGGKAMQVFRAVRPGTQQEGEIAFNRDGLTRLKRGLEKAGLDARFFAWPPEDEPARSAFRGLKPLEAADAGIFFGRDAPIVEATDRLRRLGTGAPPRLMVVLGASGAGKSSFLRAGLLPRLARDDAHFVVLPPIRPERAAISGENGLVRALEAACRERPAADIEAAVAGGAAALRPLLASLADTTFRRTLAEAGSANPPMIVVAIDQAEELFRADGSAESQRLLDLVRDLTVSDDLVAVVVIFAIRSDSYDALEHARALEGLRQDAIPLLPMPRSAYKEVIEGPVRRIADAGGKLVLEPQLTARLLDDIDKGAGSDALPLLAFTLEQLDLRFGPTGVLKLRDYEASGGLGGAIDAAVERAFVRADADPRIPRERGAREMLLRRGLIPWLAGIDPHTKSPRRNIARLADIPPEAAPLIDLLVEERLLSTDVQRTRDPTTGGETLAKTIEPTHEALLRQWGLLEGWLAQDFGLLATLEGVQRSARDWDANARDPAWLAHAGGRLAEAQALDARPDIAGKLDAMDRGYVAACCQREDEADAAIEQRRVEREAEQERRVADAQALAAATRRTAQRTRIGLAVALVLAAAAVGFGLFAKGQKTLADQKTVEARTQRDAAETAQTQAEQRSSLLAANVATKNIDQGAYVSADLLLLNAAKAFAPKATPDALLIAESNVLDRQERTVEIDIPPQSRIIDSDKAVFVASDAEKSVWTFDDRGLVKLLDGATRSAGVWAATVDSDDSYLFLSLDGKVERSCRDCAQPTIVATLPSLARYTPRTDPDWHATATFYDGWLVRESPTTGPGEPSTVIDILDTRSRQTFQVVGGPQEVVPAQAPNGEALFFDGDRLNALKEKPGGYGFEPIAAELNAKLRKTIPYASCLTHFRDGVHAAVLDQLEYQTIFDCRTFGSTGLLTVVRHAASADSRSDFVFFPDGDGRNPDGKGLELLELLKNKSESSDNMTSVSIDPATGRIAAVQDKNLFLIAGSDIQVVKNPTAPSAVRFLPGGRIALFDGPSGRIRVLQTQGTHIHSTVDASMPQALDLLHIGGCPMVRGGADSEAWAVAGGTLTIDHAPSPENANVTTTRIRWASGPASGGLASSPVTLAADCLQVARDGKRALARGKAVLSLHPAIRSPADLGEAIDLPVDGGAISSAFLDETDGSVLVTDGSSRVVRWSIDAASRAWTSATVFEGELGIVYAEPDETGQRLIIVQEAGMGVKTALVYSIAARQRWFDLGTNYRMLDARYVRNGDVAVFRDLRLSDLFHTLTPEAYVKLMDAAVPTRCRSASADVSKSPCWPLAGR